MDILKKSDFPEVISAKLVEDNFGPEQVESRLIENFEKGIIPEELFLSSMNVVDKLEKGKRGTIGEIRTWSGKKYQKTAEGWVPVKENASKSSAENYDPFKGLSEAEVYKMAKSPNDPLSEHAKLELNKRNKSKGMEPHFESSEIDKNKLSQEKSHLEVTSKPKQEVKVSDFGIAGKVGIIHEHNGKKYKLQSNGKWLEVSEHGMTKKEHEEAKAKAKIGSETAFREVRRKDLEKYDEEQDIHHNAKSKLSNKEYTDEEVGLGTSTETKVQDFGIAGKVGGGYRATGTINGKKMGVDIPADMIRGVANFEGKELRQKIKAHLAEKGEEIVTGKVSSEKHEFSRVQQDLDEKVNSLSLLTTDGWKESWSKNVRSKSYGDENFVKSMSVRVEGDFVKKETYFTVDCGYSKSPEFGEEANKYYSQLTSLREKKFSTAREAAKAADQFAKDWNKEE